MQVVAIQRWVNINVSFGEEQVAGKDTGRVCLQSRLLNGAHYTFAVVCCQIYRAQNLL
jgi:hypothetical protein